MVNLCTASVGNIAVGSVLRISVCILTLALVVHSPGVKRSPSDGESKRHRGRPVLGSHRPGRGPRLLLGGVGWGGRNPDVYLVRHCVSLRERGCSSPLLCLLLPPEPPPRDGAHGVRAGSAAFPREGGAWGWAGGETGKRLGPGEPRAVGRAETGLVAPEAAEQGRAGPGRAGPPCLAPP